MWMCLALLFNEALRTNTLVQVRTFALVFLVPETAAWCVLYLFAATASVADGRLVLRSRARRLELALADIAALEPWQLPSPARGFALRLANGKVWRYGLATGRPEALAALLAGAGAALQTPPAGAVMQTYAHAALAIRRTRFDHPLARYLLLPLALAIPAFHLHQQIAYGAALGEYYSFGLAAYLSAFALWWAAWSIGVVLCEALLRAAIEAGTLLAALLQPAATIDIRHRLERGGQLALFLGLPAWLLVRVYAT